LRNATLPDPVLVGRKSELRELKRCLDLALKRKGKTVFISGEAGSGKTRLVNEFLNTIKQEEVTVLYGWCLSNATLPYFPFVEALSSELPSREAGTFINQRLSTRSWMSEVYPTEKLEKNLISTPQVWRDQAFASVTKELLFTSSTKPLILVLEDMHWADSASLALLHYISRAIANEKILVLVTYRSEELGRDSDGPPHQLLETIQVMGREGIFKEIKLTNLNQEDVKGIAESMLGGKVDLEFARRLSGESRGNPLYVVEFLRMLSEHGSLVRNKGQWRLSVDEFGIPSKVRDVILRRIGILKLDQRRVLDVASVIGDKFNPSLIGAVLSKDRLEILELLNDILKSTSLVRVEENLYTFDHEKSREVLYEEISSPLKMEFHERIAEQIEKSIQNAKEVSFSDLAYHYVQAGNIEKSAKYSLAAGQDALARFSNTEAIKHFKYVLEAAANLDELAEENKVALEGLGDAYAANCMYTEAIEMFDQLAESGTGSLQLRALRKAMDAAFIKGDKPDLLLEYAEKAENLAVDDQVERGRVILKRGRAFGWAGRGELKQDLADYETALQIFEEENSAPDIAEALWRSGEARLSARDLFEKGLGYLLRSRVIFRELGDLRKEIAVSRSIGGAFMALGLFPEAKREFGNVLKAGKKIGVLNELARAIGILGFIDEYEGKFEEALSKVLRALEYVKKTDVNYVKAYDLGALTRLYSKLGCLKKADEYFDKLSKLPSETLSTFSVKFNYNLTKAIYFAAKGQLEESNQIFEALSTSMDGSPFINDYIWALEKQGRIEEAKARREKFQKKLKQTKKWFKHAKVQLSIMAPRKVHTGEVFEMHLDLVNISKRPSTLVRVEGLIPSGCKVVSLPSFCSIENRSININKRQVDPFQVETIKINMSYSTAGIFELKPRLHYTTELGEPNSDRANPITITVQLGSSEEQKATELFSGELKFKSEAAEKTFNYLVNAFQIDYLRLRMSIEKSGWRTRSEIVRNAKVTKHSMYGRSGRGGKVTAELTNLGAVESRFFLGERGRRGRVLKMRILHRKEFVKRRVESKKNNNSQAKKE
jgi:tetratricopeptide (TPR) repeat protein